MKTNRLCQKLLLTTSVVTLLYTQHISSVNGLVPTKLTDVGLSGGKNNLFCTTTRHVHIAGGKDTSTSIIISFSSLPCDLPNVQDWDPHHSYEDVTSTDGAILIGKDPNHLDSIVLAEDQPLRYNATIRYPGKTKFVPFDYWSEYQHHVVVDGLEPNSNYYYKCITAKKGVRLREIVSTAKLSRSAHYEDSEDELDSRRMQRQIRRRAQQKKQRRRQKRRQRRRRNMMIPRRMNEKEVFSFKTGPRPGKNKYTKFAIIGDMGVFDHTKECLSVLTQNIHRVSAILLVGDISYANGDHRIWDDWFDMMDSFRLVRYKPLFVAAGNHDSEGDVETGTIFASYESRFLMPRLQPPLLGKASKKQDYDLNYMYKLPYDYGNSFYSFVHGSTHNIILNSFADFEPESNQYTWLVRELEENVNRSITPWLTVTIHCPIYNTFKAHHNDPQLVIAKLFLEPIFVKHHVNFVFSGHLHAYMRTHPVVNNKINATGPIHIVLGNGGRQANAPFLNDEPEDWVALRDHTTYGYGTMEFLNSTMARYEWVQTGHNAPGEKRDKYHFVVPEHLKDEQYFSNQYINSLQ